MQLRTGRRGLIILGMHRSGTSAVTRVVNLLGARLPTDLVAASSDNPLGFWESARVIALNETFMREIGVSPDNADAIPDDAFRSDAASLFAGRIRDFLEETFGDASLFALKDPRIARLAPLWLAALRGFGAEVSFVLPFRSPREVARSLATREAISIDHSTLLWLRYVLDAERASRNFARVFVEYDVLARDWRGEVEKMSRRLGLSWPKLNAGSSVDIDDFLHPTRPPEFVGGGEGDMLSVLADECYRIHRQAAASGVIDSERLDEIAAELGRAESMFLPRLVRMARSLDGERAQVVQLSAAVAALEAALVEERFLRLQGETAARADQERGSEEAREALRAAESHNADLERRLDVLQVSTAASQERSRALLAVKEEAEAELRGRVGELQAAMQSRGEEHLSLMEAREAEHARALSAVVQGERAMGERLLEVMAETRRSEERAEAVEHKLQPLADELQRARHNAGAHEARVRSEGTRYRAELARALAARDEVAMRLRVIEEALDAQRARVDLVLGSRSWALTRPVRGLSRVARRFLRGGF